MYYLKANKINKDPVIIVVRYIELKPRYSCELKKPKFLNLGFDAISWITIGMESGISTTTEL